MSMTVYIEEAKAGEKICPHLPVDTTTEVADGLQRLRVINYSRCWGGRCAMWRWARTNISDGHGGSGMKPSDDTHGYCGLAGIPAS